MRIALIVGAVAMCVSVASADINDYIMVPIGEPIPGGSWSYQWANFALEWDLIAIRMATYPDDQFESPGWSDITAPGWSVLLDGPVVISMAGPQQNNFTAKIHFAGNSSDPLVMDWAAFRDGQDDATKYVRTTWNGSSWKGVTNSGQYWAPKRSEVVPAPGAVLLGVLGLGLVGWMKRRAA